MYYPINYGYIEGTMAADGEEEDAYILGVTDPVSSLFFDTQMVYNGIVSPKGGFFWQKNGI